MKKMIILKTGDTFPAMAEQLGDFEEWILKGLGVGKETVLVKDIPRGDCLPRVEACKAVVITGSHSNVTENRSWSLAIEQWIPHLIQSNIPLLGICFGHQLLARAMGGGVDFHGKGIEIGTTEIEILEQGRQDTLFKGLPETFKAHVCHSQTVIRLPDNAVLLARNAFEPHHAFRIGQNAWGVQFHPEFDDTIMAAYTRNMETRINESGLVLSRIMDRIEPTPIPVMILKRFGQIVA